MYSSRAFACWLCHTNHYMVPMRDGVILQPMSISEDIHVNRMGRFLSGHLIIKIH